MTTPARCVLDELALVLVGVVLQLDEIEGFVARQRTTDPDGWLVAVVNAGAARERLLEKCLAEPKEKA